MGFLTRLLAGLTAAAALGAGLTGTANAVDVTGRDRKHEKRREARGR